MDPTMDALASLDSQQMVDCTLACDGGQIEVHKMVLSVCSTYLKGVIQQHPVQHPIIILPSIKINDLRILVNYMYTGELLSDADMPSTGLMEAAKFLGINSIKDFLLMQQQLPQTPPHNSHDQHDHHDQHDQHDQHDDMDDANIDAPDDALGLSASSEALDDALGLSTNSEAPDEANRIRCHLCDIRLSDVKCLYRHVLTRHLPDRWGYRCEFCDREFSRDDHLMRHYTTKHKGMDFDRDKIRETRRHNREMAKTFHDQFSSEQMSTISSLL
ncbi:Protein bric-a-brac 1, partial [Fragariocoptes setiger]